MFFTNATISAPYEDLRKVHRDGTHDWLVTVKADNRVATKRFSKREDADAFRDPDRDTQDIVNEAFNYDTETTNYGMDF